MVIYLEMNMPQDTSGRAQLRGKGAGLQKQLGVADEAVNWDLQTSKGSNLSESAPCGWRSGREEVGMTFAKSVAIGVCCFPDQSVAGVNLP